MNITALQLYSKICTTINECSKKIRKLWNREGYTYRHRRLRFIEWNLGSFSEGEETWAKSQRVVSSNGDTFNHLKVMQVNTLWASSSSCIYAAKVLNLIHTTQCIEVQIYPLNIISWSMRELRADMVQSSSYKHQMNCLLRPSKTLDAKLVESILLHC